MKGRREKMIDDERYGEERIVEECKVKDKKRKKIRAQY